MFKQLFQKLGLLDKPQTLGDGLKAFKKYFGVSIIRRLLILIKRQV